MMTRNDGDHETVVYSHCTNRFEHHIVAPRNLVMEFSEYLQWDRVAPFFAPPCSVGAKLACHANSFFFRNSVVIETGSSPHRYRCHSILNLLSLQLFVSSTWTLHRETIQNIFRGLRLIGLVRLIFYQWLFSVMSNDAKCALSTCFAFVSKLSDISLLNVRKSENQNNTAKAHSVHIMPWTQLRLEIRGPHRA